MIKRSVISVSLIGIVSLALAGCASGPGGGQSAGPGGKSGGTNNVSLKDCSITLIPKTTTNPFYTAVQYGANKAATELGGRPVDYVGTAQASVPAQIQRVQGAALHKACAVAIASLDPSALAPALTTAAKQGTKVVAFDADVQGAARPIYVQDADATALGVVQAQLLAKAMNYKGTFAILSAQSTAANQNAWNSASLKELKKPKYAGMQFVKEVYGNDDYKTSYDQAISLLQAYPNLGGILAPTPAGLEGAVKAKGDLHIKSGAAVTGLGWPPSDSALLKARKLAAFALYSPDDLGYLTYYTTAAYITGKISGKAGESFTAGHLGKRMIEANGVVTLGPPVVYTAKNVDSLLEGYRTK